MDLRLWTMTLVAGSMTSMTKAMTGVHWWDWPQRLTLAYIIMEYVEES